MLFWSIFRINSDPRHFVKDFAGKHVVVSAGGNREPIDPIRHITNRYSGKMGFALADAAKDRRAGVTLVTTIAPLMTQYAVAREILDRIFRK